MSDSTEQVTPKSEIDLEQYRQRTDRGKKMTLQQAAEMQGISKARMRSLAAAADSPIVSWKETPEGIGLKIAYVFEQDVRDFFTNRPARKSANGKQGGTPRVAGAKSFVVKLSPEQVTAFREAFPEVELADRYNYDPEKSKAYRESKKAAGIAQLDTEVKAQRKARKAQQQQELELPENAPEQTDELTSQLDALLAE